MKIMQPALIPFVDDELDILRLLGKKSIADCDVLINYNYQKKHFQLLENYVDPGLIDCCLEEISDVIFMTQAYEIIEKSIYKDYYRFFLCKAMRDYKAEITVEEFKDWLNQKHDFTFKMIKKPKLIFHPKRMYHNIIIPKIPEYTPLDNKFNRIHQLVPSYYDPEKIWKLSLNYLVEGGVLYLDP